MSKRKVKKEALIPEEEKLLEKLKSELGKDYCIAEGEEPDTHFVCKQNGDNLEEKVDYKPYSASFSKEKVFEEVRDKEVKEGPRAS